MSTNEKKSQQSQWGKTRLVDETFEKVKKEIKVAKSELNKVIETFLQTIKDGLESGAKVTLKDYFSLFIGMSKETLKNNPRDRQQKLIVPAQRKVKIRVSDNWKKSLNPLMKVTDDLKKAEKINDLEMVYKKICSQEIYRNNKERIDGIYNGRLTSLRATGKK